MRAFEGDKVLPLYWNRFRDWETGDAIIRSTLGLSTRCSMGTPFYPTVHALGWDAQDTCSAPHDVPPALEAARRKVSKWARSGVPWLGSTTFALDPRSR